MSKENLNSLFAEALPFILSSSTEKEKKLEVLTNFF